MLPRVKEALSRPGARLRVVGLGGALLAWPVSSPSLSDELGLDAAALAELSPKAFFRPSKSDETRRNLHSATQRSSRWLLAKQE